MNVFAQAGVTDQDRLRFKMRQSPATAALIIAFVLVYVATWFDSDGRIFEMFAKVNDRIRSGEVWRLFTASFLHAGLLHISVNAVSLASIGPAVELIYGRLQYLTAFLVGGAAGIAASVVFTASPSVGASAGLFALLGVLLVFALRSRKRLTPPARRFLVIQVLIVVGLNLGLGLLVRFIDNAAHIGGLLGGAVLGLLLRPKASLATEPSPSAAAGTTWEAPSAPATPRRIPTRGRTYLGWAGQGWKIAALALGLAPWAVYLVRAMVRGRSDDFPGWEMLAFVAGALVVISAKCPQCGERVFWWCISKLPENRGLATALLAEACPLCGYPDAKEENPHRGSSRASGGWKWAVGVLIGVGALMAVLTYMTSMPTDELLVSRRTMTITESATIELDPPARAFRRHPALCLGVTPQADTPPTVTAILMTNKGEERAFAAPFYTSGRNGKLICLNESGPPSAKATYTRATIHSTGPLSVNGVWFMNWPD